MVERLDICLLGGFSMTRGGHLVKTLNAERPQSLLAYLLLHRHSPVSRQRLAYAFWPDSADEQARTNLRNLLHTLRRSLPDADSLLQMDTHTVQWSPGAHYTLDVADFQAAWQASTRVPRRCYLGDAPGGVADQPTSGLPAAFEGTEPDDDELLPARANFAVLLVSVHSFDWFHLAQTGHRRALIEQGVGCWVTP